MKDFDFPLLNYSNEKKNLLRLKVAKSSQTRMNEQMEADNVIFVRFSVGEQIFLKFLSKKLERTDQKRIHIVKGKKRKKSRKS